MTLGEQVYQCLRRQLDGVVSQLSRDRSLVLMAVADDLTTLNAFAVVCQVVNVNGPWLKRDSIVQFFLLQPAEFAESSDAVLRRYICVAFCVSYPVFRRRRFADVQCRKCNRTSLAGEPSNAKLKTCARCKSTRYCSFECQKLDWPRHKLECTPYSETPPEMLPVRCVHMFCEFVLCAGLTDPRRQADRPSSTLLC